MTAIANYSERVIWLVKHYADSDVTLGSILRKWHYRIVQILDSEVFAGEIENKSNLPLPDLIILDIAPPQKNIIELIRYCRHNSALSDVPLLCLCNSRGKNRSQVMEVGASDALSKPFELEELYLQVKKLLAKQPDIQNLDSTPEMTFIFSELEPSSSIKEQEHWFNIFQEHLEQDVGELLKSAGYKVNSLSESARRL